MIWMIAERNFCSSSKLGSRTSLISDGWNMNFWRSNQWPHVTKPPHKYPIHIIRCTFDEVQQTVVVEPSSRVLRISLLPAPPSRSQTDTTEISRVYFRAGCTPVDYPTAALYDVRALIEKSRAINIPSIVLQLSGGNKVQEVLTQPGVLESFLLDPERGEEMFTQQDVDDVRSSLMAMWGPDADGDARLERARGQYINLVLKPHREGGGNNIYKSSILSFLETLPTSECLAWIAMEIIRLPKQMVNWLVQAGGAAEGVA